MADGSGAQKRGKKVLIGMNGTDHSTNAFEWYVNNGLLETDELILAYCTESNAPSDEGSSKAEEKIQQVLSTIESVAKSHNVKYTIERLQGSPGEALVKASKDFGATLIVAGSRGHSKLRRVILGSISDHIVKHSMVPVVIVKYEHANSKEENVIPSNNEDLMPVPSKEEKEEGADQTVHL